jgi:hypothetical protein
MYINKPDSW